MLVLSVLQLEAEYIMQDRQIAGNSLESLILPMDGNIPCGTPGKLGKISYRSNERRGHSKNSKNWTIRSQGPHPLHM